MQHLDEGTIHSWLDGALSAEEAERVSAHVEECPQCAAAVAEARGFIAAASRILTALDHVPKGVVPVAARAKPRNWVALRAAAAVLVVALGSFAVLKGRMGTREPAADTATLSVGAKTVVAAASQGTIDTLQRAPLPTAEAQSIKIPKPAIPARVASPSAASRIGNQETRRQDNVSALAAAPQIRVVGRPEMIGEKRTLYEVAPGDTVLLAEALKTESGESMVAGVATSPVAQSADTSAALRIRVRGAATMSIVPDSQGKKASFRPAAAPTAMPPISVETLNGVTTLTWVDRATGNTTKLSGRHSPAELLEIRRRIEQLRAAETAAKKTP